MREVDVNPLQEIYLDMKDKMVYESDIINSEMYNIGQVFNNYLLWKLKKRELINIQIRGQVRKGKSTVGILKMYKINKLLGNPEDKMYSYILPDNSSFLRFIKKGEENVCVLIDEYNKMTESGANATTERNLFEDYSARFAAKYNHRVACSPSGFVDMTTEVYLDVLSKDDGWTRLKVLYKDPTDRFGQNMKLIGWMDVDVSEIIKTDLYRIYEERKMRRLGLLEKHGITDERPIEMAKFVITLFNELVTTSKIEKVTTPMIKATLESIKLDLKERQMYSLIYDGEIIQTVTAMLDFVYFINKLEIKKKTQMIKKSYSPLLVKEIDEQIQNFKERLGRMIATQRKYEDIWQEYIKIG